MKVLDEIKKMEPDKNCKICLGKGTIFIIRPDLAATKFREVRPCPRCLKQIVRIRED